MTGILWKIRKYLSIETIRLLYFALIHSNVLYGLSIWGSVAPSSAQRNLQLIQNNAIRAICGSNKFDHVTPLFRKLEILKIHDLCKFEIAKLMFLYTQTRLPLSFKTFFRKSSTVHSYKTRSSDKLFYYTPRFRLVRFQKSFKYRGTKIWNNLPKQLKTLNFKKFQKNYKTELLEKYKEI